MGMEKEKNFRYYDKKNKEWVSYPSPYIDFIDECSVSDSVYPKIEAYRSEDAYNNEEEPLEIYEELNVTDKNNINLTEGDVIKYTDDEDKKEKIGILRWDENIQCYVIVTLEKVSENHSHQKFRYINAEYRESTYKYLIDKSLERLFHYRDNDKYNGELFITPFEDIFR
jgi:hypothetical protein